MFNVCPNCGEYTDEKEVVSSPSRAICPSCRHESKFLSLPLFIVTGASGSGKTTVALELVQLNKEVVVLDQDILWSDAFNTPDDDYRAFRNTWLRMVKNIHQAGKSVVLFGSAIPDQFEFCTESRYFDGIHYMTLVCRKDELERRLKARPQWRNSGSEENVKRMLEFNSWLAECAAKVESRMSLIDTSDITADETVSKLIEWIHDKSAESITPKSDSAS